MNYEDISIGISLDRAVKLLTIQSLHLHYCGVLPRGALNWAAAESQQQRLAETKRQRPAPQH